MQINSLFLQIFFQYSLVTTRSSLALSLAAFLIEVACAYASSSMEVVYVYI